MSTESPQTLLTQWHVEQLPTERAIGQLLQHVIQLYAEIEALKMADIKQRQALSAVNEQLANRPTTKRRPGRPKKR